MGLKHIIEWASEEAYKEMIRCLNTTCEDCEHRDKPECTDEDRKYGGQTE